MPDCTGFFAISQTVWSGTLIFLCLYAIGTAAYVLTRANLWNGTAILCIGVGVSIIVFSATDIVSTWTIYISDPMLAVAKAPMVGLIFIASIVSLVSLPRARPLTLLKKRRDNIRKGMVYNQCAQANVKRLYTKCDYTRQHTETRANCLLRTLSIYLRIVPKADVSYERIAQTIQHLRRSQEFLIANNWNDADLQDVLRENLTLFGLHKDAILQGPQVLLNPMQVQAFYMGLFELGLNSTTQAQKIGRSTRFAIRWNKTEREHKTFLSFLWHEEKVKVTDVSSPGVGTLVLEKLVPSAFDGEAKLSVSNHQVDWKFTGIITA